MKKTLLTFALSFSIFVFLTAQSRSYEAGITTNNFRDFSGILKKKTKKGNYHRFSTLLLRGDRSSNTGIDSNFGLRTDLTYGYEKRKSINKNMFFLHGFQPRVSANIILREDSNTSTNFGIGIGYILGLAYEINKEFYVSIETVPTIAFALNSSFGVRPYANYISANGSLTSIRISLLHRFEYSK